MKILKPLLIFLLGFTAGALALWTVAQNHTELRYYLLEHPTGNQPQVKVDAFLQTITAGDQSAALALWEISNPEAHTALTERREHIIDELIAADFDLEYKILRTEWWKTCCMPGVVCDSRSAGGARISVQFIDQEGQPFLYKFDVFARKQPYFGAAVGYPPRDWVIRDVYPSDQNPIFWKLVNVQLSQPVPEINP